MIILYTGKPPFRVSLVEREIEIDLICPLSANPLRSLMDRNKGL